MNPASAIYNMPIIQVYDIKKTFTLGPRKLNVINGMQFEISKAEFVVLMGPSGSGKTTLLNLLGGIDRVTSGNIIYNLNVGQGYKKIHPTDITKLNDSKLTTFRRKNLSYVFQFYSLIPTLTALENVQLMAELIGLKGKKLRENAEYWLKMVGLDDRMDSFPGQLSGGENQRVAIARAIAKRPQILLCDEPTGQLDQKNGRQIVETLYNVCKTTDTTIVMVTHDMAYREYGDKIIYIEDGRVVKTEINFPYSEMQIHS